MLYERKSGGEEGGERERERKKSYFDSNKGKGNKL